MEGAPLGIGYLPMNEDIPLVEGFTFTRDAILRRITELRLRRPIENIERRCRENEMRQQNEE